MCLKIEFAGLFILFLPVSLPPQGKGRISISKCADQHTWIWRKSGESPRCDRQIDKKKFASLFPPSDVGITCLDVTHPPDLSGGRPSGIFAR